ncbi:hypothetical protein TGPRC2_365610 [Toxoplasma gondii TgCatPRC2]|uniref:Uncharacterized protein n=3 Tax=Toxoplasma gondii TaxID=5811 RepID=A0A151HEJ2_TOXGO|nr:hypothetical protein TGFOU_365610 [Toxoplasma gondii FOU]KYK67727.1 hypothetical protein TGPRC2_365610 [Toxoplasma gondii TgCatPRC2]PUA92963.1 hypothetical protein TGBR9_365610 [Toxoplasma gondii TgCATBr9]
MCKLSSQRPLACPLCAWTLAQELAKAILRIAAPVLCEAGAVSAATLWSFFTSVSSAKNGNLLYPCEEERPLDSHGLRYQVSFDVTSVSSSSSEIAPLFCVSWEGGRHFNFPVVLTPIRKFSLRAVEDDRLVSHSPLSYPQSSQRQHTHHPFIYTLAAFDSVGIATHTMPHLD